MFTALFWKGTVERLVKTIAQTVLAVLGADWFNVMDVDWPQVISVVGGAAALSLLSSLLSAGVGPSGTPSLVADDVSGKHSAM